MTTPFLHITSAFLVLIFLDRLYNLKIPFEHLIIISLGTLLPDLFDKVLTGSRYPFHSLLFSGILILTLNVILLFIIYKNGNYFSDPLKLNSVKNYIVLISIAFLIHPIMDLEGLVPLFYPLDHYGYRFDIQLTIKQGIPPEITEFWTGFVREPFDYAITYDHEASLITTFDILLGVILFFPILIKGILMIANRFLNKYRRSSAEGEQDFY